MSGAVAAGTQGRVPGNTRPRALGWFVGLALLLHLPLTPIGALLGLLSLLRLTPPEEAAEQLNAIPVSLLSPEELAQMGLGEPEPPPPPEEPEPADEPEATPAVAPPTPRPPPPKPRASAEPPDAAAPDAGPVDGGRGPPDSGRPAPAPVASAPPSVAGPPDAGPPAVASAAAPGPAADPMALAGKAASVADPNANVKLLVQTDRIRGLAVAPRVGKLLAGLPQWKSFFGPTALDPIQDIERIYVAGPQFRSSADVVAVLEYRVETKVMRNALDALVKREPKGEWYDGPVPAARARADRADRVFVLPKGKLLMMVPPHLKDDAVAKAPGLSLPRSSGRAAVFAFVATPWRAFLGLRMPVEVPRSIRSVSLSVIPTEDGGAVIEIDALDESAELASDHAALLTRAINAVTQQNLGSVGSFLFGSQTLSLVEPVTLRAEGARVRGSAKVTPRQLSRLLGLVEGFVESRSGAPVGAPRPGPGAPAASTPAPPARAPARPAVPSPPGRPAPSPPGGPR